MVATSLTIRAREILCYGRIIIDVREAVKSAKEYARAVLDEQVATVEEIEQEVYKDRDVWKITLGFPTQRPPASLAEFGRQPKEYKSFLIDRDTSQVLAVKIRELTA